METISLVFNSIIQIILFSFIPFTWWFLKHRKQVSFLRWIGIKKPVIIDVKKYVITFIVVLTLYLSLAFIIPILLKDAQTATSVFVNQGIKAILPAIIYAFLQTGLSEEIFFRGFLTKVLSKQIGFKFGNLAQALIFGLIHGWMFIADIGFLSSAIIILITGTIGLLMGYINEILSDGSIIPSFILHGLANLISAIIVMFNLT